MTSRLGLFVFASASAAVSCTPLPWTQPQPQPSAATPPAPSAPASAPPAPSAPTPPPSSSAAPVDAPLEWVRSCADVEIAVRAGAASVCNDANGVVVVATWHLEDDHQKPRAVGLIERFQNGKSSLNAPVSTDDATVIAALVSADSATLEVKREAGAIRVSTFVATGEDYRTQTEIVSLFRDNQTAALWSGLGTTLSTRMDACSISNAATFGLTGGSLERTITSTAHFTSQRLEPTLLAELKRDCVPAKPSTRKDKFVVATAEAPSSSPLAF